MRFRDIKKQSTKTKLEQNNLPKVTYATFTDRIKALITDIFMIYAPILYITTYVFLDGKDEFQSSQLAPMIGVTLYGMIYAILLSKFGQTPGKKAYLIKVINFKTNENLSFFRAILRFIAFLFTATTLLGLFLPLYRKDKRALHDLISNSAVVADKEPL